MFVRCLWCFFIHNIQSWYRNTIAGSPLGERIFIFFEKIFYFFNKKSVKLTLDGLDIKILQQLIYSILFFVLIIFTFLHFLLF